MILGNNIWVTKARGRELRPTGYVAQRDCTESMPVQNQCSSLLLGTNYLGTILAVFTMIFKYYDGLFNQSMK